MRKEIETKDRGPKCGYFRVVIHNQHGVVGVTGWYTDDADALSAADRTIDTLLRRGSQLPKN